MRGAFNRFNLLAGTLVLSQILLSCTGGSSDAPNASSPPSTEVKSTKSTTLSGIALLGPIQNGTVSLFELNADGSRGNLIVNTKTNSKGEYSISVPDLPGPFKLEITGGSYVEESGGATVNLTEVIGAVLSGKESFVTLSPYSHFAASKIASLIRAGASLENAVKAANLEVGATLGVANLLGTNPTSTQSTDAKVYLQSITTLSQSSVSSGSTSAHITQLVGEMIAGNQVVSLPSTVTNTISPSLLGTQQSDLEVTGGSDNLPSDLSDNPDVQALLQSNASLTAVSTDGTTGNPNDSLEITGGSGESFASLPAEIQTRFSSLQPTSSDSLEITEGSSGLPTEISGNSAFSSIISRMADPVTVVDQDGTQSNPNSGLIIEEGGSDNTSNLPNDFPKSLLDPLPISSVISTAPTGSDNSETVSILTTVKTILGIKAQPKGGKP